MFKLKRGSTSREDDRSQRHRHKSHKRRRHKSRSESRSRSVTRSPNERKPPVVYMNPAFQPVYGVQPMPSQAEIELRSTLVTQLSSCEQRISSLESELRAAQLARGRAEQTVFDVNAEKLRLESHNAEIVQVMKTLERAVEELQKNCNALKIENDRRRRDLENAEKTISSCKEQNNFLNERNSKLVKKCEGLCEENKTIHNRRDESARELADLRPRMDSMQAELRQRIEEGRKMIAQLRSFEEKERIWKKEKGDLEKRIEIKDAVAAAERKNNDEWKKRSLAEKAELERKVKLADPEITRALDAVCCFVLGMRKNYSIFAIDEVRTFYERKLETVACEVNDLKKKLSDVTSEYRLRTTDNNRIKSSDSFEFRSNSAPPATELTNGCALLNCSNSTSNSSCSDVAIAETI
ncbi:unnamed protein product [Anisakis simplex]|uniref:Uncharacterized protein n=1 Tax=Anisakis simplex TaxID=6269 RepID=A0A0M3K2Z9_ANISI|nr:unnamed protein product [Anisakis simplex]